MKYLLGLTLIIGGISGLVISLLGDVVVSSSLPIINELQLSLTILFFSIITFIGGIYTLLTN